MHLNMGGQKDLDILRPSKSNINVFLWFNKFKITRFPIFYLGNDLLGFLEF
jgi:hypothetical protein